MEHVFVNQLGELRVLKFKGERDQLEWIIDLECYFGYLYLSEL